MQSLAALPYANVTVKVDVDVPRAQLPRRAPRGLPRHRRRAQVPAPLPRSTRWRPSSSGSIGEIDDHRAQAQALQGRHAGHGGRPGRPRARLRPVPARGRRLDQDHHRRPRAAQELGPGPRPGARGARCAPRSTSTCSRPARSTSTRRSTRARAPPAASSRSTRATAACSRSAPTRRSTRRSSPSRSRRPRPIASSATAAARRSSTARSPAPIRPGSTFKPITALAAMSTGVVQPGDVIDDNGCIKIGTAGQEACNAGKEALGPVNMTSALSKSSDVYFYTMGQRLNALAGQPLQKWAQAHRASGHRTRHRHARRVRRHGARPRLARSPQRRGGGLPQEEAPSVRHRRRHQPPVDRGRRGQPRRRPGRPAGHAAADGRGLLGRWPTATAACARTSAPRWRTPAARLLQRIEPGAAQHVTIDPAVRQVILDGLHDGTIHGTSADVWKGWDQSRYPVFGKTGTAQRLNRPNDQSWYVVLRQRPPAPDRGRGHHRGRRLRRRRGRPGGPHHRFEVVPPADQVHRGQVEDVLIR